VSISKFNQPQLNVLVDIEKTIITNLLHSSFSLHILILYSIFSVMQNQYTILVYLLHFLIYFNLYVCNDKKKPWILNGVRLEPVKQTKKIMENLKTNFVGVSTSS